MTLPNPLMSIFSMITTVTGKNQISLPAELVRKLVEKRAREDEEEQAPGFA